LKITSSRIFGENKIQNMKAPLSMYKNTIIEIFEKYVQKKKLRANFIKTEITTLQGAKGSFVVVLKQV
jgi:hypothetical protein